MNIKIGFNPGHMWQRCVIRRFHSLFLIMSALLVSLSKLCQFIGYRQVGIPWHNELSSALGEPKCEWASQIS